MLISISVFDVLRKGLFHVFNFFFYWDYAFLKGLSSLQIRQYAGKDYEYSSIITVPYQYWFVDFHGLSSDDGMLFLNDKGFCEIYFLES